MIGVPLSSLLPLSLSLTLSLSQSLSPPPPPLSSHASRVKFLIVEVLQKANHIVGMTGDGVNDAPALKKADIGIAVQGCTDAARAAADIVLTSPGLSTIVDGILLSRQIFQRMKNYCVYRISCTIWILFFFAISICLYDFQIPVFVIVLISLINDGTIITIAYDNVLTSRLPESWDLPCVCGVAVALGACGVAFSLGLYNAGVSEFFPQVLGLPKLARVQLEAMMYVAGCGLGVVWGGGGGKGGRDEGCK